MTASGAPSEGERIGHYLVGRRLGGGGMGVVHEATDEMLGRKVALKVITPALAEDPAFRTRFTREAQAQASLDSPHVVHVYGHGEDGGRLWLASQLIPDGDLRTMLDQYGAPPLLTALDVMQQVASGLAAAHAAGLVHRDIKPANVLLRRREGGFQAYLADFGIARLVDAEATRTASSATVGTPSYMAPELHTGGTPGVASDIYSLGCLLWATLSGRAPYAGTSDFEIVTAHREQPVPQLPEDAPAASALNQLLRRLMAKQPADRPATAAEVRDELARLRSVAAIAAPATPTAPRRRLLPFALAGVAVLVLAGTVALGLAISGDDAEPSADPPRVTGTPSSLSSPSASSSASSGASSSATAEPPSGDVDKAVASMAAAFAQALGMSQTQAECTAREAIDEVGLARLVEIGMFDADLAYVDVDLADAPDVKAALSSATVTCLAAG